MGDLRWANIPEPTDEQVAEWARQDALPYSLADMEDFSLGSSLADFLGEYRLDAGKIEDPLVAEAWRALQASYDEFRRALAAASTSQSGASIPPRARP